MLNETPSKKIEKTKSAPKLVIAVAMVLLGVALIVFGARGVTDGKVYIRTPRALIKAEVVDTEVLRKRGISGKEGLSTNQAMLLVFDKPDKHGIWMKNMKFSIDIVWLDISKKVVSISEEVSPDSYPLVYKPSEPSKYVIELGAGGVQKFGIKVGQKLSW